MLPRFVGNFALKPRSEFKNQFPGFVLLFTMRSKFWLKEGLSEGMQTTLSTFLADASVACGTEGPGSAHPCLSLEV